MRTMQSTDPKVPLQGPQARDAAPAQAISPTSSHDRQLLRALAPLRSRCPPLGQQGHCKLPPYRKELSMFELSA